MRQAVLSDLLGPSPSSTRCATCGVSESSVLPLRDPGAFHGACWRVDGRNIIVLKQRTPSRARWLTDLLHELRHAGEEPDKDERAVIEAEETPRKRQDAPEEQVATQFAGDVSSRPRRGPR